jgi:DHA2 family multidrug resistance protein-like MFS transporter
VANVALPDIGQSFDASQTALNLVAVGYSLGLAASVLYLGALGDRYGRKLMLVLGVVLSVPACLVAAWAPSIEVLIGARLVGGLSAGMAFSTTLALITALWSGPARTKSIALWSGIGGGHRLARPTHRRWPARPLLVGLGVPHHPPPRGCRPRRGGCRGAEPRQRDH